MRGNLRYRNGVRAFRSHESHTGNDTLTSADAGMLHDNRAATGTVVLTLDAATGTKVALDFRVAAAFALRLLPAGVEKIRYRGTLGGAGKYIGSSIPGAMLRLVDHETGIWEAKLVKGNKDWVAET